MNRRKRRLLVAFSAIVLMLLIATPVLATFTIGWWKNHPSRWGPVRYTGLDVGCVHYDQAELLEILKTPPRGDATIILAHQLIAAKLNVGAMPGRARWTAPMECLIGKADGLLCGIGMYSKPKGGDRWYAIQLSECLDLHNNIPDGTSGPDYLASLAYERAYGLGCKPWGEPW